MSNFEKLLKLNDLEDEISVWVETAILDGVNNKTLESHVSGSWDINSWEKISKETEEDIVIVGNNLGDVEISEGSQEHSGLSETWLSSLHDSCHDEHRLNSSETPIIMGSFGEQISAQEVKGGELLGKHLGGNETLSHQHVLTNQLEVWHDHSNWSEQSLETLWQLGSSEVTWVHGNESTASWVKGDLVTLDDESLLALFDGVSDGLELDGAHRKHLWHKSVELIEASPGSGGSETLENLGHTLVIHLIGAVEHIASFSESGSEILGGLCLTGSGWSSWCTSHLKMEGLGSSDVNSIGQGSNNESWSITEVFITVVEASVSNFEDEIVSSWFIETLELSLPLEVVNPGDLISHEEIDDISRVSVHGNQTHDLLSHWLGEVSLHHLDKLGQIIALLGVSLLNRLVVLCIVVEGSLAKNNPLTVVDEEGHHGWIHDDPVGLWLLREQLERLLGYISEGDSHGVDDILKVDLDLTDKLELNGELDVLNTDGGDHALGVWSHTLLEELESIQSRDNLGHVDHNLYWHITVGKDIK
jgi:hypothetical protein